MRHFNVAMTHSYGSCIILIESWLIHTWQWLIYLWRDRDMWNKTHIDISFWERVCVCVCVRESMHMCVWEKKRYLCVFCHKSIYFIIKQGLEQYKGFRWAARLEFFGERERVCERDRERGECVTHAYMSNGFSNNLRVSMGSMPWIFWRWMCASVCERERSGVCVTHSYLCS